MPSDRTAVPTVAEIDEIHDQLLAVVDVLVAKDMGAERELMVALRRVQELAGRDGQHLHDPARGRRYAAFVRAARPAHSDLPGDGE